jgi:hypothetical protein
MPQLPDFRDIHADASESLPDIADDPGAVFDEKAQVKGTMDVIFDLKLKTAWLN